MPQNHYKLLQTSPSENLGGYKLVDKTLKNSIGFWPMCICILCTVANVCFTLFSAATSSSPPQITRKDLHLLRRPSQFIRLDEIIRPSPLIPRKFNIFPLAATQIDEANPQKVFEDNTKVQMIAVGTITPEDRKVLVTKTVSTIVQFRAIDFGMEVCELNIRSLLPPSSAPSHPFALNVFRLNATSLDTETLSHKTRPPRLPKLATIEVAHGTDTQWNRNFTCKSDSLLTFELACSPSADEKECYIEWWQKKDETASAIFITQHSTL